MREHWCHVSDGELGGGHRVVRPHRRYVLSIVWQPESPIERVGVGVTPTDPPLILPWVRYRNRTGRVVVCCELTVVITTARGGRLSPGWEMGRCRDEGEGSWRRGRRGWWTGGRPRRWSGSRSGWGRLWRGIGLGRRSFR